jgi:hypothetical protein
MIDEQTIIELGLETQTARGSVKVACPCCGAMRPPFCIFQVSKKELGLYGSEWACDFDFVIKERKPEEAKANLAKRNEQALSSKQLKTDFAPRPIKKLPVPDSIAAIVGTPPAAAPDRSPAGGKTGLLAP